MADIPAWFNEEHYLASKAEQLNTLEFDDRTDWTPEEVAEQIDAAGLTPYEHFEQFGNSENVSPNPLFDAEEYLANKAAQLNAEEFQGHTDWNAENVLLAFQQAGLTAWTHFQQHGWAEGVNPSSDFNVDLYFEDKAAQLNDIEHEGRTDWTADEVKEIFQELNLDPITHYEMAGKDEGIEPKTAEDAALVELSNRLDALKAAQEAVDTYADDAEFEYTDSAGDPVEFEKGKAKEADIEDFYEDVAGQVGDAVEATTDFETLDASVQDEFIAAHKAVLQAVVNAEKAGKPAKLESLLAAAELAREARVQAVADYDDAQDEKGLEIAAFNAYHTDDKTVKEITDPNNSGQYDPKVDSSNTYFVYKGKIYVGQAGTEDKPVQFADLDEAAADLKDLKYGAEVLAAVAAAETASKAQDAAKTAQEKAVLAVYVALNDELEAGATPENFTGVIGDKDGGFKVSYTGKLTFAGEGYDPDGYDADDAKDLQDALDAQNGFVELVAKFEEARALYDGLVELQEERDDARSALTNPEDHPDIPGLGVKLVEVSGAAEYTLGVDDDNVVLFSADVGNTQTISAGFDAGDLIFFGKGYTFVELGDKVPGTDRLGDVDVLEIFYGVVGGNTVFYVEADEAAGWDLSGAALTQVELLGVTDELAINDALGFVGLNA